MEYIFYGKKVRSKNTLIYLNDDFELQYINNFDDLKFYLNKNPLNVTSRMESVNIEYLPISGSIYYPDLNGIPLNVTEVIINGNHYEVEKIIPEFDSDKKLIYHWYLKYDIKEYKETVEETEIFKKMVVFADTVKTDYEFLNSNENLSIVGNLQKLKDFYIRRQQNNLEINNISRHELDEYYHDKIGMIEKLINNSTKMDEQIFIPCMYGDLKVKKQSDFINSCLSIPNLILIVEFLIVLALNIKLLFNH